MSDKTYEYYAGMTCDGCKNAITRILSKVDGVKSIEADVNNKTVLVKGTADQSVITDKLNKWSQASGKEVRFIKEL